MNTNPNNPIRFLSLVAGLIASALLAGTASAQTLSISSLLGGNDGSPQLYGPGATATVVVTLTGGSFPLSEAWVVAEMPFGFIPVTTVLDGADLQGTFPIGTNVPFGLYHLNAFATDTQGTVYSTAPAGFVPFAVEAYANSYQITPGTINLRYVGDQSRLKVNGTLPDGRTVDFTYATVTSSPGSSYFFAPTNYYSLNPQVAVVDNNGVVTAVGAGMTTVGALLDYLLPPSTPGYFPGDFGTVVVTIQVTVPTTIRGDLNGDGRVDLLDLQILEERLNSAAITSANLGNSFGSTPYPVTDARDLNGDGLINALDARLLVTLCTQPGCIVK
jgi:Dockerin type I domain/Bacterial Ig-like domain (group 2)